MTCKVTIAKPKAILIILVACFKRLAVGCSNILTKPSIIKNKAAENANTSIIIGSR